MRKKTNHQDTKTQRKRFEPLRHNDTAQQENLRAARAITPVVSSCRGG